MSFIYDEIIATNYQDSNYIIVFNITKDGQQNHVLNVQEYFSTGGVDIQAMALADFDLSQKDDDALFLSMQNRGRTQSFVEKKK